MLSLNEIYDLCFCLEESVIHNALFLPKKTMQSIVFYSGSAQWKNNITEINQIYVDKDMEIDLR